jgi:predicted AlkP superfamily phosphohydrolase/phosphomutase
VSHRGRVVLIGLDSVPPKLLFDWYADEMPVMTALRRRAAWGPLASTVPPITVPAWSCMLSGKTPGELGVYGFRNRRDHGYDRSAFATSTWIKVPRLWDLVGAAGRESVVVGVPGTYPPSPIRGQMVSCFLAPSTEAEFTYPPRLREEVQATTGGYVLDVADFRNGTPASVAQRVFDMTEQRFELVRHLATGYPWDLLAFVDMGPDRLHHVFWEHCDPEHPKHQPGNQLGQVFRDYYRALDRHLGRLLEVVPDDAAVLVVSDHGAQPMFGGFRFNQWLIERGLLVLHGDPRPGRLDLGQVDWSRTTAWGDGGYYGRLFLNVEGREPQGVVPRRRYEAVRQELIDALERLPDHTGAPMGSRVFRPQDVYPEVRNVAPDLIVYFGDLHWRAIGSLDPGGSLYTFDNDTGPDGANHAEHGVFVLAAEGVDPGPRDGMSIYDVAPALQAMLGLPGQPDRREGMLA